MKHTAFALEDSVHFINEQPTELSAWYGEESSGVEKCTEDQEAGWSYAPQRRRLAGAKS